MDWLTFQFCVLIWVLCVSKSQSQLLNSTSNFSHNNQSHSFCEEGQPVVPPDECNTCTCFAGVIYCTNLPCPKKECEDGEEIPSPDECNKCICRRGQVMCSNVICIPAPNCDEYLLYPTQNKCNSCMCFKGFITCTSNVCYDEDWAGYEPRDVKTTHNEKECIEGSSIPVPNKCVQCICENGKKKCKYICSPTNQLENRFGDQSQSFCDESQPIVPPDECNTCSCFAGVMYCKKFACPDQKCVDGEEMPPPDACNKCICRRGHVMCTDMICIPAPNCTEKQLYPPPNKCNTCICLNGFISCTSNDCNEENWRGFDPRATTKTPKKKECEEGSNLPGPNKCVECFCENGRKRCKYICIPTDQLQNRFGDQKCVHGEEMHPPDACNKCICRRGQVVCTNMTCIPAPKCAENQFYPHSNKCNACICQSGFITCTGNVCHEENGAGYPRDVTKATKNSPKKKECEEGSSFPGPNKCVECSCENGSKRCKDVCSPTNQLQNRFGEPECFSGQVIPPPDDCNSCICFEGEIHCTQMPCHTDMRTGQECRDGQPVFRPDECNECYCLEGRLECSDLVCIRGSKCVPGQVIPKPDNCNACKCIKGHILCTNHQCPNMDPSIGFTPGSSPKDVKPLDECHDGDVIPTLPPPLDCKTCNCIENTIICTGNICVDSAPGTQHSNAIEVVSNFRSPNIVPLSFPEIKDRIKEQNEIKEQTNLQNFDKQISVEPLIDILYKNNDKSPTKVIHTHAYNGFHQEIKLQTNNLPKQTITLLKVLAISLDNAALASISKSLLTSPDNLSNCHDSKMPLNQKTFQNNLLGERNVIEIQSSKLVTSGSQSNETIYVIPNTEPFGSENPQSILPLPNKPKTIWNTVSAPATIVIHNNQPINPHNSLEENMNVHHDDRPSSILPSIEQSDMIRNPSKFSRPGTFPKRTHDKLTVNTPYNPILNPKQIYINDSKMNYAPFYPENNQLKPVPSGFAQQKSLQSPFVPNRSKYYSNQFKPQKNPFILNQNQPSQIDLPTFNNKAIQNPSLFPNTQNLPTVSANQYTTNNKQQLGLKPWIGNPLNDINNQNFQQFKQLPLQNGVNPEHYHFVPNPAIYYKNEYEAPKIKKVKLDEKQFSPHSETFYTPPEHQNQLHIISELDHEEIIPKVQNKTRKYNTTHPHYEKHTTITYVLDFDPNEPAHKNIYPNLEHNTPHTNEYEHYSPDQESQEMDLTRSKVNYYLNLPTLPNAYQDFREVNPDNEPLDTSHYDPARPKDHPYTIHSQIGLAQNQHKPLDNHGVEDEYHFVYNANESPAQLKHVYNFANFPLDPTLNHNKAGTEGGSADGFRYPSNSAKDPILSSGILQIPQKLQLYPKHIQHLPGMFDERDSAEDPSQTNQNNKKPPNSPYDPKPSQFQPPHNQYNKNIHNQPNSPFGPMQDKNLPEMFDELGSANGFQYLPNSAERPLQIEYLTPSQSQFNPSPQFKENINKQPYSPYEPIQNKNSAEDLKKSNQNIKNPPNSPYGPTSNQHLYPKQNIKKPPNTPYGATPNQHLPGMFDDSGSGNGVQYPSHSAESPLKIKGNKQYPIPSQFQPFHNQYNINTDNQPSAPFGPVQDKHLPGRFDERESANEFQYPYHSAERPLQTKYPTPSQSQFHPSLHFKGNINKRPYSPYELIQNKHSAENPTKSKSISPHSPVIPTQNQHTENFNERGSGNDFQYPPHSAENTAYPKDNLHNRPKSQFLPAYNQYEGHIHKQSNAPFGPTQNQYSPEVFEKKSLQSVTQNFPHPQLGLAQNYQKDNMLYPSDFLFDPTLINTLPEVLDKRGFADVTQYPSRSVEKPTHKKNNPDTTIDSELLSKIFNDKNNNLRPTHLDHDQCKPRSFDDLLNGTHNILWSIPEDDENVLSTITSAPKPIINPEHDQYKPSSSDNLLNEIHQIPWPIPNQDNDTLGTDTEMTTPRSGFTSKDDHDEPSMTENSSLSPISNQNILAHENDNEEPVEQEISAPTTELTNAVSTEFNLHTKIKPDSDPVRDLPIDDEKISDYFDQLYPLYNAVKKLNEPPFEDSALSGDQLDLLPFLFPSIAKILNYEPEKDQDETMPVEEHGLKIIPLLLKLKFKQLPNSGNGNLNWLKSKLLKFVPQKYNVTVNPNDIDMSKIFYFLKKLTRPKMKDNLALKNVLLRGFDPENIEKIMNDFQEDTLTTTPNPRSDTTQNYGNWFKTIASDGNGPQAPQSKYPYVHIIIHHVNDEGKVVLPPYMETGDAENLAIDMTYEELGVPLFSKVFNHRFRHRTKDQKDECGDGTHWISNCHVCSCSFGQPMCYKKHDCVLRTFGEPMSCKPYSHFKMGCYNCECNGDGVAECDDTDCNLKLSGKVEETTEKELPVFNKFFYSKETDEILKYYNVYKKLPKDYPTQDLQAKYPTCERGTSWFSSCHKCECNENGQHECIRIDDCKLEFDSYGAVRVIACTQHECIKIDDYKLEFDSFGSVRVIACTQHECIKIDDYKLEFDSFGAGRVIACTQHECIKIDDYKLEFDSFGKPGRCKPNTKFYPKTNSMPCVECSCNDEGQPYCPTVDDKKH